MTADTLRLSVADAAARLGISTDTVRRKLKRGQVRAQRDNHGQWWVEVPADAKPTVPTQHAAYEPRPNEVIEELRGQIRRLRTDLDAAYAREVAERDRHAAEVGRLESLLAVERDRLVDVKVERDRWHAQAQTLAQPARRSWWPWRRTA
jgi:excisionase family DNA binding protein